MVTVPPLTARDDEEKPYSRRAAVEGQLERLWSLSSAPREAELESGVSADGTEISMEALLHFARVAWRQGDRGTYERLFRVLFARVEANIAKTVFSSRLATAETAREAIMDRFVVLLAEDCDGKHLRLDYFEVNFAHGLACMRASALRNFDRQKKKNIETISLDIEDPQTGEPHLSLESEAVTAEFLLRIRSKIADPAFRSDLYLAIDELPADQREVVLLSVDGMPTESMDNQKMTIAQTLKCTDRTVRNMRTRAAAALRVTLKDWNLDE
jgi:DNA-directed RNA polymerase specialized sigma24 family protein